MQSSWRRFRDAAQFGCARQAAAAKSVAAVLALALSSCGQTSNPDTDQPGAPAPPAIETPSALKTSPLARQPNIILIVTDDLGINDLSLNPLRGDAPAPPVDTPHIDSIGAAGAVFLQAYATHATCAPSRAGLLTGRYQHRFGFEFNPGSGPFAEQLGTGVYDGIPGLFLPDRLADVPAPMEAGLPGEEVTLAEQLKAAGYRTSMFGKWHLGFSPNHTPSAQGFDYWLGFLGGASLYAPKGAADIVDAPLPIDEAIWDVFPYSVLENGEPVETEAYQTDLWADGAVDVIRTDSEDPFFIYLAFNAPHNPLQAPRSLYDELDHIDDHEARVYAAMMVSLDEAIGRILDALKETGQADETLIVFTSDNGGTEFTRLWEHNLPLRGYKGAFWEGGVRVPLFIQWPDVIEPSSVVTQPVSLLDLAATFQEAGAAQAGEAPTDSVSIWPSLEDSGLQVSRDAFFWRAGDVVAVRQGEWKLFESARPEPGRVWLYHLDDDLSERNNLADQRPEKLAELRALARTHFTDMTPPSGFPPFELPVRADPAPDLPPDTPLDEIDYIYWPG